MRKPFVIVTLLLLFWSGGSLREMNIMNIQGNGPTLMVKPNEMAPKHTKIFIQMFKWWNIQMFSFKCSNGEIFKCFYSNVQMFSFKYSNVQMVNTQNVVIEKNQNHLRVCWHYTFQQTIGLYQTNNEIPKFTNSSVWVNILLKNKTKTFPN